MKIKENQFIKIPYEKAKEVLDFNFFFEVPIDENANDLFESPEDYADSIALSTTTVGASIDCYVFLHEGKLLGTIISDAPNTAGNNECEHLTTGIEDLQIETTYTGYDNKTYDAIALYDISSDGTIENIRYGYYDENGELTDPEDTAEYAKIINKEEIKYEPIFGIDLEDLRIFWCLKSLTF